MPRALNPPPCPEPQTNGQIAPSARRRLAYTRRRRQPQTTWGHLANLPPLPRKSVNSMASNRILQRCFRLCVPIYAVIALVIAGPLARSKETAPDASKHSPASAVLPVSTPKRRVIPKSPLPLSAQRLYERTWGVDIVGVKAVESGAMLRFSYRVVDAQKAQALNDKKSTPYLYDLNSHVRLEVPSMEKVGQLRQSANVEEGRVYWMVFSNKERLVKPGTRVDVRIGQFIAQGLLVE